MGDRAAEKTADQRVGMTNKIARTVWALVAHNRTYDKKHVSVRPF